MEFKEDTLVFSYFLAVEDHSRGKLVRLYWPWRKGSMIIFFYRQSDLADRKAEVVGYPGQRKVTQISGTSIGLLNIQWELVHPPTFV
jgi:hypothetical protein